MNIKQKKKAVNSGLYVVLALMIVTITVISILTLTAKRGKDSDIPSPSREPLSTSAKPNVSSDTEETKDIPQGSTADTKSTQPDSPDSKAGEVLEPVTPPEPVYVMPVNGHVSKDFSDSVLIYSLTMDDYRAHMGIDICAPVGSQVSAFSDGNITDVYDDPICGTTVVISHADGMTSYYMNLQKDLPGEIKVGKSVKAGDVIGGIGETMITEISDASHLHFELRRNNEYVNPMDYLTSFTGVVDYTE